MHAYAGIALIGLPAPRYGATITLIVASLSH